MKILDAKTKVCPFSINQSIANVNGMDQIVHTNSNCICGECMAWVYTEEFKLVDELCMSFTNGELDKSSYSIAQNITPSHHKINGSAGSGYETWARKIEIAENEKSGYCARIGYTQKHITV